MNWNVAIKGFLQYARLEKGLSANTIEAYERDVARLAEFAEEQNITPLNVKLENLQAFVHWVSELGLAARSQARIVSGIKAFYRYLLMEDLVNDDPAELLEAPKTGLKLPEVLTKDEIDRIIAAIDLSKPEGTRNKAMIETLYSCGLRVSELINLQLSNLYFDEGFVRVVGKGNKERLVPIGDAALKYIDIYLNSVRVHQDVSHGHEDFVFLNRRGKQLTRVMIFSIVKDLCRRAQINKNISPHSFRHSFATHLVDGGADLRAIQEMLGHQSITTTEIYTHLDRDFLRETIMSHHPRARKG
ncbi:MAG: site-specific tyrosine recombinase XerD [Cryomorphaceae bacterium]|nr:MAG: site-specific tyrosine recombinase XerD [Cryomorphaceae bacterium]